ncbi:MAG: metallophosphoesterase [Candidatus Hodarchaeaceae archaeon]|nr:metallophosphoesterase [Candidatus Hodarchaeaceae archaeon]
MARYNPSFVLFPGDLVEIWDDQWEWDNWFAAVSMYWVSEDGLTIPIIPAMGNHDVKSSGDYDPMKDAPSYYGRFNLPGNEQWYALSWGPDLRIIVLDSEVMGGAAWRKQLDWLEGELSASKDYLWKIAILHRGMVSSTGLDQRMINDLAFLFDKYHVDLVMMGHRHIYERSYPLNWTKSSEEPMKSPEEGTIYIVGGAWGGGLSSPGRPKWFSAFGPASKYSFVLIDVFENGTLYLRAIDVENNIFDELILHKEVSKVAEVPIAVISAVTAAAVIGILYLLKRRRLQ